VPATPGAAGKREARGDPAAPFYFLLHNRRGPMTVLPRARLMHLIAILAAAGTFATRATCYAELPWLVRFGRGALAITVVAGVYSRIGRTGSSKTAMRISANPDPPGPNAQLVAVASHEVKTPLTGIKAYLELLADGDAADDATRAEFLNGIGSQVERLERVVDGLFTAALAEECRETSTPTACASAAASPIQLPHD
jgi:signal transduction histidine kinase